MDLGQDGLRDVRVPFIHSTAFTEHLLCAGHCAQSKQHKVSVVSQGGARGERGTYSEGASGRDSRSRRDRTYGLMDVEAERKGMEEPGDGVFTDQGGEEKAGRVKTVSVTLGLQPFGWNSALFQPSVGAAYLQVTPKHFSPWSCPFRHQKLQDQSPCTRVDGCTHCASSRASARHSWSASRLAAMQRLQ